jgi:hypothetical protein
VPLRFTFRVETEAVTVPYALRARRHVHFSRSAILSRNRTAPDLFIDQGKT